MTFKTDCAHLVQITIPTNETGLPVSDHPFMSYFFFLDFLNFKFMINVLYKIYL